MTDQAINQILYKSMEWEFLQPDDGKLIRNLLTDYLNLEQLQYYGFKTNLLEFLGLKKISHLYCIRAICVASKV